MPLPNRVNEIGRAEDLLDDEHGAFGVSSPLLLTWRGSLRAETTLPASSKMSGIEPRRETACCCFNRGVGKKYKYSMISGGGRGGSRYEGAVVCYGQHKATSTAFCCTLNRYLLSINAQTATFSASFTSEEKQNENTSLVKYGCLYSIAVSRAIPTFIQLVATGICLLKLSQARINPVQRTNYSSPSVEKMGKNVHPRV